MCPKVNVLNRKKTAWTVESILWINKPFNDGIKLYLPHSSVSAPPYWCRSEAPHPTPTPLHKCGAERAAESGVLLPLLWLPEDQLRLLVSCWQVYNPWQTKHYIGSRLQQVHEMCIKWKEGWRWQFTPRRTAGELFSWDLVKALFVFGDVNESSNYITSEMDRFTKTTLVKIWISVLSTEM